MGSGRRGPSPALVLVLVLAPTAVLVAAGVAGFAVYLEWRRAARHAADPEPVAAVSAAPEPAPPPPKAPPTAEQIRKAKYDAEERRVAGLATDLAVLTDAERQFVERARAGLKGRPPKVGQPFLNPDRPGGVWLVPYLRFFNWYDVEAYCVGAGVFADPDALAPDLKLTPAERHELRLTYLRHPGLWDGDNMTGALRDAVRNGPAGIGDDSRSLIRHYGLAPFLRHLPARP